MSPILNFKFLAMQLKKDIARETVDFIKIFHINDKEDKELSPLQLRVLTYIRDKKYVNSTDIADAFNVTPATVTAQMDKLEKNKWLRRCSNGDDRRVVNIKLTAKAKKNLDYMVESTIKKYDWVFTSLNDKEQKEFLSLLKKINQYSRRDNMKGNTNE